MGNAKPQASPPKPTIGLICPQCSSDRVSKSFLGGSKRGAIACFVVGGFIGIPPVLAGDLSALGWIAICTVAGIAALTSKRYKCQQCKASFNDPPVTKSGSSTTSDEAATRLAKALKLEAKTHYQEAVQEYDRLVRDFRFIVEVHVFRRQ
jgi:DNA-directed RNA polymerase subunit RPC12/RpoP